MRGDRQPARAEPGPLAGVHAAERDAMITPVVMA
jgi:hypothetical protein